MTRVFTEGRGPAIWLLDDGETAEALWAALPHDFSLLAAGAADWERDYSPWPAPALRQGGGDFPGGGPAYLRALLAELPRAEAALGYRPPARGMIGYSLAGLFALYALVEAEAFHMAASVSGSLWYDGWTDYLAARPLRPGSRVYLSLGSREAKSGSPRMRTVADQTAATAAILQAGGAEVRQESNPGGHFTDPPDRMAKALRWMMEQGQGTRD